MTLPASGAISLSQVNTELGNSSSAVIGMNQSSVRTLFGVASGQIKMSDGYGKANQFSFSITSNQANTNLRTLALNAGWNGTSKVVATINSGVILYSNSTGSYAFTINGSFPNGVQLINNGTILGRGGNGASSSGVGQGVANGGSAGPALLVQTAVAINNSSGRIAGGGGGGGSGRGSGTCEVYSGKGSCNVPGPDNDGCPGSGGIGGSSIGSGPGCSGGGGGSLTSAGGTNNAPGGLYYVLGAGGAGGSYGAGGAQGGQPGSGSGGGSGGAAGAAVVGNGNISWLSTGTRNGAIS